MPEANVKKSLSVSHSCLTRRATLGSRLPFQQRSHLTANREELIGSIVLQFGRRCSTNPFTMMMHQMPSPMDLRRTTGARISKGKLGFLRVIVDLFTKEPGIRDPPSAAKTEHLRLITIPSSHYCEKGRWALDIVEADANSPQYYTEDGHPAAFLSFQTVPASNDTASASPMIVYPDKSFIYKSDIILRTCCPQLYPKEIRDDVEAFENDLGVRLGACLRCYGYTIFLDESGTYFEEIVDFQCQYSSWIERFLFRTFLNRGIDKAFRRLMHLSDDNAAESKAVVEQIFQEVSDRLEKSGGEYLMDTADKKYGFTATDLSFAALVYTFVRPPQMDALLLDEHRLPPEFVAFCHKLRNTTAGQHALKVYANHRPVNGLGKAEIKTLPRDRVPWKELSLILSGLVGVIAVIAKIL